MALWGIVGAAIKTASLIYGSLYSGAKTVQRYRDEKRKRQLMSVTYKNNPDTETVNRENPLPIVYGKNRVTGTLIYRETTDLENDAYDAAYAFCEGEVEEVTDVQFNSIPVNDLTSFTATTYTGTTDQTGDAIFQEGLFRIYPSADSFVDEANPTTAMHTTFPNNLRVQKAGSGSDERTYLKFDLSTLPPGLTLASAKIVLMGGAQTVTGRVIAYTSGAENWAEDTITWNNKPADGSAASNYPSLTAVNTEQVFTLNATGLSFLTTQYGAATTASFFIKWYSENVNGSYASTESPYQSPYLEIRYSGGTACGYRNTAYAAVHIHPENEKLGGANPTVTALVQGLKIKNWDTVGGAYQTTYSRNPAWQVYDLLINTRYGAGITETDLDDATFKAAAVYCDATVTDDDGVSVARYTSDVVIDGGVDGFEAANMILRACAGYLYTNNGKICIGIESSAASSWAFTESNIIAGTFSWAEPDLSESPNIVRAMFIDAGNNFQKTLVQVEDEPDQDSRDPIIQDIDLLGVSTRNQAIRLAKIQLLKGKLCRAVCAFRVSIYHCAVACGDVCTVTHTVPGWTTKSFRIVKVVEHQNDEIDLTLEEYNANVYGDGGQGISYTEYPSQPNPVTVRPPTDTPDVHRIVFTASSGLTWTAGTIYYKGVGYEIASGSTSDAYIYFDPDVSTTDLQTAAARPTINANTWVMAYYDAVGDAVYEADTFKILHAGLLQANSITANEIKAGAITITQMTVSMDDIPDGSTYAKPLSTYLSAGKIVLGYGTFTSAEGTGQRTVVDGSDNTFKLYDAANALVLKIDDNIFGAGTQPGLICDSAQGGAVRLRIDANNVLDLADDDIAMISQTTGYLLQLVRKTQATDGDAVVNLHMVAGLTGNFIWGKLDNVEKFAFDQAGNLTLAGTVDGVDVSDHSARHENGGADEISVAGLSGTLADAQASTNHNLIDTTHHPVAGLTSGHFLKATGATTYAFGAHGLTYSDVGATAAAHEGSAATSAHSGLGTAAAAATGDFAASSHTSVEAAAGTLGHVKVGTGLGISSGVLNITYPLPLNVPTPQAPDDTNKFLKFNGSALIWDTP